MSTTLTHTGTARQIAFGAALLAAPELAQFRGAASPRHFIPVAEEALRRVFLSQEWVDYVESGQAAQHANALADGMPVAVHKSHPLSAARALESALRLAEEAHRNGAQLMWN